MEQPIEERRVRLKAWMNAHPWYRFLLPNEAGAYRYRRDSYPALSSVVLHAWDCRTITPHLALDYRIYDNTDRFLALSALFPLTFYHILQEREETGHLLYHVFPTLAEVRFWLRFGAEGRVLLVGDPRDTQRIDHAGRNTGILENFM